MQYLIAPSNQGWPTSEDNRWVEANSWTDLKTKLAGTLTVDDSRNPYGWVDYKREATNSAGDPYIVFEPTPRMIEIHHRHLCCNKAVVVPCMCAVAYRCPEHHPNRQQCVGTHD